MSGPAPAADRTALAERFEQHRPYLRGVAYRLLGSLAEADDAVQEAWLRLDRRGPADAAGHDLADLRGWLTVVVSRICLDQLRSARARRETYVGPWLPEPVVTVSGDAAAPGLPGALASSGPPDDAADPADRVTLAESVSMAMLVVLETLTPAERTAFVLHDVFGMDFGAVGAAVGRTPEACRQLASRARRHVRDRAPRFEPDPGRARRVAEAFMEASAGGDIAAMVRLLAPDAVLTSDGGGVVTAARRPVRGADRIARFLAGLAARAARSEVPVDFLPAAVNGGPGLIAYLDGRPTSVFAYTVTDGLVSEIDVVLNPAKLRTLDPLPGAGGRPDRMPDAELPRYSEALRRLGE